MGPTSMAVRRIVPVAAIVPVGNRLTHMGFSRRGSARENADCLYSSAGIVGWRISALYVEGQLLLHTW